MGRYYWNSSEITNEILMTERAPYAIRRSCVCIRERGYLCFSLCFSLRFKTTFTNLRLVIL